MADERKNARKWSLEEIDELLQDSGLLSKDESGEESAPVKKAEAINPRPIRNEEIDHQIGDGAGGTHGSHADTAAEPAYDDQVGGIEQQLQNAGEDDGNGVKNDIGQQRAGGHASVQRLQENTFFRQG